MKLFLDANVLVSVLNKEYPVFPYSSRVLSLSGKNRISLYTSPVCLAVAFYFAEKKSGKLPARQKMKLLCNSIGICNSDGSAVQKAIKDKRIHDFEDGIEYYTALNSNCDCIVTENTSDFYFSEIEVLTSQRFLEKYFA